MTNPLDRKTAPAFKQIEKLEILRAEKNNLSNGIPVYFINAGTEDLMKIELIFDAGTFHAIRENHQISPLLASAANHLIVEGTSTKNSSEIAEQIDFYGSFLHTDCDKDFASVSLYSLNKHIENTLPILEEIIKDAAFPEKELSVYLQNAKQKFVVDSEKIHVIGRRKFNEVIFGKNHPYGKNVETNDFDNLQRSDILNFFQKYYTPNHCRIIVSGKIPANVFSLLEKSFGNWKNENRNNLQSSTFNLQSSVNKKHFVERKNQVQSAIRIGRPLFTKNHAEYPAMKVVNTVLGGYFGSRLMANIREDKGYTYGIGSAVFPLVNEGYFFISTEVGTEVSKDALKQIYFEIERMRNEKVNENELLKVRNYMLGEFMRSIDGAFALADRLKGLLLFGLDYDYYDKFIHAVKFTTADEIQELSQKYLQETDLYEVVAGSTDN